MARPLQDGSRAEPTAAVSGSPAFPMGGTVALPPAVCRSPLAWPPGLSCRAGCGRRRLGERSAARGTLPTTTHYSPREEDVEEDEGMAAEPEQRATEPNGHLSRHLPTLEQEIGARLRHMGDQFQRDYEQREHRPHGALWGHFYHFVFHLLGILYNLPVRG